jgi:hypothetical protein
MHQSLRADNHEAHYQRELRLRLRCPDAVAIRHKLSASAAEAERRALARSYQDEAPRVLDVFLHKPHCQRMIGANPHVAVAAAAVERHAAARAPPPQHRIATPPLPSTLTAALELSSPAGPFHFISPPPPPAAGRAAGPTPETASFLGGGGGVILHPEFHPILLLAGYDIERSDAAPPPSGSHPHAASAHDHDLPGDTKDSHDPSHAATYLSPTSRVGLDVGSSGPVLCPPSSARRRRATATFIDVDPELQRRASSASRGPTPGTTTQRGGRSGQSSRAPSPFAATGASAADHAAVNAAGGSSCHAGGLVPDAAAAPFLRMGARFPKAELQAACASPRVHPPALPPRTSRPTAGQTVLLAGDVRFVNRSADADGVIFAVAARQGGGATLSNTGGASSGATAPALSAANAGVVIRALSRRLAVATSSAATARRRRPDAASPEPTAATSAADPCAAPSVNTGSTSGAVDGAAPLAPTSTRPRSATHVAGSGAAAVHGAPSPIHGNAASASAPSTVSGAAGAAGGAAAHPHGDPKLHLLALQYALANHPLQKAMIDIEAVNGALAATAFAARRLTSLAPAAPQQPPREGQEATVKMPLSPRAASALVGPPPSPRFCPPDRRSRPALHSFGSWAHPPASIGGRSGSRKASTPTITIAVVAPKGEAASRELELGSGDSARVAPASRAAVSSSARRPHPPSARGGARDSAVVL